jgi:hypothetical protein
MVPRMGEKQADEPLTRKAPGGRSGGLGDHLTGQSS